MIGGKGNDTYLVDNVDDVVTETSKLATEIDTIKSSVNYMLGKNVENLTLTGTAINGTGNTANNLIIGNASANVLDGGLGSDSLQGGAGNDTYIVNSGGDKVNELKNKGTDTVDSSVNYTLPTNVENLVLTGTNAINGTGNTSANKITGNSGNNILDGGKGLDILTGGAGQDIFRLSYISKDTIKDFSVLDDTIQLKSSVFNVLTAGNLSADNFAINTAADANDYLVYNSSTGALFYDANGSSAGAAVQIAMLGVNLSLTHADFVVI
jgi:Ca2+-binding RTX toxin-like protein